MEYPVNKGAGNPVEFKGLKSQYLFVFAGGLVTVLLAVVILYLAGVDQWICIPFRDRIRRSVGMGGVPAERPLRRTRSYEAAGGETPSALPDPSQREFSDYFAKKKNDNHEKCIESGNAGTQVPLLSVENGCIVSKDADLTVAFEVELPELYTVTAEEYEAMHSTWIKAARVLPEHSIVSQAGLVHEGELPSSKRRGGTELPLRAAMSGTSTRGRT